MVTGFPIAGEKYVSMAFLAQQWDIGEPLVRLLFRGESDGVFLAPARPGLKPRMAAVTESLARAVEARYRRVQ